MCDSCATTHDTPPPLHSNRQLALRTAITTVQDSNLLSGDTRGYRHCDKSVVDYFVLQYLLCGTCFFSAHR